MNIELSEFDEFIQEMYEYEWLAVLDAKKAIKNPSENNKKRFLEYYDVRDIEVGMNIVISSLPDLEIFDGIKKLKQQVNILVDGVSQWLKSDFDSKPEHLVGINKMIDELTWLAEKCPDIPDDSTFGKRSY